MKSWREIVFVVKMAGFFVASVFRYGPRPVGRVLRQMWAMRRNYKRAVAWAEHRDGR